MPANPLAAALSALCVVLALATMWLPAVVPAQDAPLYHLAIEVIRSPEKFAGYVEWSIPVSAGALQVAGGTLLSFVDPTVALKLLLSLGLAVLLVATQRLSRLAGGDWPLPIAIAAALFVGFTYAMGFFNFLFGAFLSLLAGSLWLSPSPPASRSAGAGQAVLFFLAAYVHAVGTAMVAVPLLAAGALCWGPRAWSRRLWPLAPAGALLAATLVLGKLGNVEVGEQVSWVATPVLAAAQRLPRVSVAAYSPWSAALGLPLLGLLVLATVRALPSLRGRRRLHPARALALCAGAALALYPVAPLHVFDFFYAQPRLPLIALMLGGPGYMPALPPRLQRLLELPLTALAAGVLALGVAPAVAAGEHLHDEAQRMPRAPVGLAYVHVGEPDTHHVSVPYLRVALHMHAYGMLGGGASAFTFPANPYLNPLHRPQAEVLPAGDQWTRLTARCVRDPGCFQPLPYARRLAIRALRFDSVLLPFAPQALLAQLDALGWRRLSPHAFEVGKASLIVVVPAELPGGMLIVRAAEPETGTPIGGHRVPTSKASGRELRLSPLPAGPITLSAFVDHDGNGLRSAGEESLLPHAAARLTLVAGEQRRLPLATPSVATPSPE